LKPFQSLTHMAPLSGHGSTDDLHAGVGWSRTKIWLFRYVIVVAVLAFCNRALPTSFLSLVLESDFQQSLDTIGIAVAAYPAAALLASAWATQRAVRSSNVIRLHTTALFLMSLATLMFASCYELLRLFGASNAFFCLVLFRTLQGISAAVYLASKTILVTRLFPQEIPYALGMVEVGVGVGAQIGRLLGGLLYDVGGFACPFCALSAVQAVSGCFGFSFKEDDINPNTSKQEGVSKQTDSVLPWSSLLSKRIALACYSVFFLYFCTGTLDTTLPQHLEVQFGPISITTVSFVMSLRAVSYIVNCFLWTQIMHRNLLSYEHILAAGAISCFVGAALLSPVWPVQGLIGDSMVRKWAVQITAILIGSGGLAALFIPSLPLMHSEVRHLGSQAGERVAQVFIAAMSLGEAVGPIMGGTLVAHLGFQAATALSLGPFLVVCAGGMVLHSPTIVSRRQERLVFTDACEGQGARQLSEAEQSSISFELSRTSLSFTMGPWGVN